MSQENVEVVRLAGQAFAEGGIDAMAEFWDPDIDWRAAEGAIDDVGEMRGWVAVRRYIEDWLDTFDDASIVAEELRAVGDDRVLAIQRAKGRAKLSGIASTGRSRSSTASPPATGTSSRRGPVSAGGRLRRPTTSTRPTWSSRLPRPTAAA